MVAQADVTQSQLYFSYNSNLRGYSVRAWSGTVLSGVLTIPETYNGQPVVEITADAFNPDAWYNSQHPNTKGITKVVLPASIVKIGQFAFHNLPNLTEVDLSACVNAVDFGGKSIFRNCSGLTTVKLPNNTPSTKFERISEGMFSSCTALTSITLPYSVHTIGYGAFSGCSKLTRVNQYSSASASSYESNPNAPIFLYVNVVEYHAFENCDLKTQLVFNYVAGSSSDYIRYPNLVIQNSAFRSNSNLTAVNVNGPWGIHVGDHAFNNTGIKSFTQGKANIGYRAFPKDVKFNDGAYEQGNEGYSNHYTYSAKHDKYSHVDADGVQYFFNTKAVAYKTYGGTELGPIPSQYIYEIPELNGILPDYCKRLGQATSAVATSKDKYIVEDKTSMIDAFSMSGTYFKVVTLNDDGELKFIEPGAFSSMPYLRELTLPSSLRRFGVSEYNNRVVNWGNANDLAYGGYGGGSSSQGIAHDTPVMAYLDMSTLSKDEFSAWYTADEFTIRASVFNGTTTYRSNYGYYWQNIFDGMYEPTLVYLPRNTEDKWGNEDFEVYGRNFIFTNDGETPYCHLYETYDYDQPYESMPSNYFSNDYSKFYLGKRNYYAIPHAFKAETAKYNRDFKKDRMYDVCIPFAVDAGKYGTFYELTRYNASTGEFVCTPINSQATQPRHAYIFVPNDDYSYLEATMAMVSAIPDGVVENGVYVEDASEVIDGNGEVIARMVGVYETHSMSDYRHYRRILDGQLSYDAQLERVPVYPYRALFWSKDGNGSKIVLEGDGRPEIAGVYRSTFDAENVKNDYRNSVRLVNPETKPMLADQFSPGTTMLINRVDYKGDSHVIANIAITAKTASTLNYRLTLTNGGSQQTGSFSIGADNVVNFNDLTVEDEFSASTATNEHITRYDYQMSMIDAKGNDIKTNVVEVPIYKTRYLATGAGFTYNQCYADKNHSMPLRKAIPAEMRMYSDAAITGYELLRNKQTVGSSAEKADGTNTYEVSGFGLNEDGGIEWMNNLNSKEVTDEDGWLMVDMQDCIDPEEAGTTVSYLPRISAKTTDFDGTTVINNTYGGVENSIVACDVEIEVTNPEKSSVFRDEENKLGYGSHYQGYAATVKLKAVLPNEDYKVYMYRLWRVLPDGTEKLLNDYSSTSANRNYEGYQWGSDYTALQKRDLEIEIRDVYLFTSIADLGGSCPTQYIARLYAQTPKPAAQAPRGNRISSTGYDAAEKSAGVDFARTDIPTAIESIKSDGGVKKVTYYNAAGVASSTPFDGLNVVVTVKADGTRQVTKMVK
ncbi:MAG: leucine-rich repeat domain-containing protein [Muribaculaceae bacterium]|nr:leucine-rich repeat domain-containing protein [Muribaculaceae bacterium]